MKICVHNLLTAGHSKKVQPDLRADETQTANKETEPTKQFRPSMKFIAANDVMSTIKDEVKPKKKTKK